MTQRSQRKFRPLLGTDRPHNYKVTPQLSLLLQNRVDSKTLAFLRKRLQPLRDLEFS